MFVGWAVAAVICRLGTCKSDRRERYWLGILAVSVGVLDLPFRLSESRPGVGKKCRAGVIESNGTIDGVFSVERGLSDFDLFFPWGCVSAWIGWMRFMFGVRLYVCRAGYTG